VSIDKKTFEVSHPNLVTVRGKWEKGTEVPDEIFVEFDRPITVQHLCPDNGLT